MSGRGGYHARPYVAAITRVRGCPCRNEDGLERGRPRRRKDRRPHAVGRGIRGRPPWRKNLGLPRNKGPAAAGYRTVCLGSTNKLCLRWKLKHVNPLEMT